jgi:hypothetical protein
MEYVEIVIKLVIGLSVLNVWLLRANRPTQWRGANAQSLKEEFKAYGLSIGMMRVVGAIKILLSLLLLASILYQPLEKIGAIGMAIMMAGAVLMHIRIKDALKRSLPAFIFLCLSLLVFFI